MKINMSVDCTPQELREFLGWPDVGAVQQQMLEHFSQAMSEGSAGIDPVSMMSPFLAPNTQAMEMMQKAFLQAMQSGVGASSGAKD
jgi:hypothetical protein